MQTIITAAGDSRPMFVKGGFLVPKSLQIIGDSSVILHALNSYSSLGPDTVVAVNKEENSEFGISSLISRAEPDVRIVEVSSSARGALVSALFCLTDLDLDEPLVIAAGDSFITGGIKYHIEKMIDQGVSAGTIAFYSNNPRWSYLSVGADGQVLEVTEKEVSGQLATTGVFYFETARIFLDAAKWVLINNAHVKGQFYVSTSLNYLISKGLRVGFEEIDRAAYQSFSLPSDFVRQAH